MDNPPAFPNTGNSTWGLNPTDGMTLRDYFAGQAIVGVVMQCAGGTINPSGTPVDERITRAEYFAQIAGEIADAMLAERSKP